MAVHVGGIILAGGKSSRMGTDKGLMTFQGKRLVEYAILLLQPLCSEIIISTNQKGYEEFGFRTVSDIYRDCGPVGGLHAALSETNFDYNLVLSCDVPFVERELLQLLLSEAGDYDAVVPVHEKGIEPLVAVYRKEMASFFEKNLIEKKYKMQRIIRSSDLNLLDVSHLVATYPRLFDNLNSPDELADLSD